VSQRNAIYCIEHVKTRGMLALMNNDNTRHNFVDKTHFFLEITEQEPNADSSRVSISSTAVSRCQRRFRALPVIGAARRWLRFTGKV